MTRSARRCSTSTSCRSSRASSFSTSASPRFFSSWLDVDVLRAETGNHRRHVLKTNFYQPTKVALSFRLAPAFLPEVEYPNKPFGLFFVIGGSACSFSSPLNGHRSLWATPNRERV